MPLSASQQTALKADILLDPALSSQPLTSDGAFAIAAAYNLDAVPDFWVWRTNIPVQEIYERTTSDGTVWSWTTYIARSAAERDCWREVTGRDTVNASLPNLRQAIADIFSGAGGATQRTHLTTIARRKATRAEKLFATGTGSTASPATMGYEGALQYSDVQAVRSAP